jgi:2-dehydropantoate 2-reductase
MKIAVVGTGALGGWYAGLLAQSGHEVHCLARSDHAVISARGLLLKNKGHETTVRVASASAEGEAVGPCDLVVVTTKSTANTILPRLLKPLLGPATLLVTLQNGMGNVEVIAQVMPYDRIVAGLCFVCINRVAPGVIDTTLAGYVRMAASRGDINPAVTTCVEVFKAAGVDTAAEASLESVLWKKLCWNIPFNGLSIAGGAITTDVILADPVLTDRARTLMKEVQAASVARGHGFNDQHVQRQFEVTVGMGPYRPSSLIDFVEGREVEVEGIWGEPLKRGQDVGVVMPELVRLISEIRLKIADRRA